MEKLSFNCDDCVQNYQLEMCYIVGNFSIIVRITILFHFFPFTQFYSILLKSTQFYSNLLKFAQIYSIYSAHCGILHQCSAHSTRSICAMHE